MVLMFSEVLMITRKKEWLTLILNQACWLRILMWALKEYKVQLKITYKVLYQSKQKRQATVKRQKIHTGRKRKSECNYINIRKNGLSSNYGNFNVTLWLDYVVRKNSNKGMDNLNTMGLTNGYLQPNTQYIHFKNTKRPFSKNDQASKEASNIW